MGGLYAITVIAKCILNRVYMNNRLSIVKETGFTWSTEDNLYIAGYHYTCNVYMCALLISTRHRIMDPRLPHFLEEHRSQLIGIYM